MAPRGEVVPISDSQLGTGFSPPGEDCRRLWTPVPNCAGSPGQTRAWLRPGVRYLTKLVDAPEPQSLR
eukprot:11781249-Alexandrium_andersonii.AAC.1